MGRLNAGTLTERISLTNPGPSVPDGRGGQKPGPATTPVVVHARPRTLSGLEALKLGQTVASSVVEFTIRYRESVTTTTTVVWKGKSYAVRQVVQDPYKEFTVLTCLDNGRG